MSLNVANNRFGSELKLWRTKRRMSQLDLGLTANVSARHISFLETGRSRPSRGMILRLCDELDVPRSSRNQLLTAAGLSSTYSERSLRDEDMAPAREAIMWTLERHAPYPGIALDRHWRIEALNRPGACLFANVGVQQGDSLLDAILENESLASSIENHDELLHLTVQRLRTETNHLGGDPVLEAAIEKIIVKTKTPLSDQHTMPAFIPARYSVGGMTLSFITTIAQFGTAEDIALAELKIELLFPADDFTKSALENLDNESQSPPIPCS